MRGVGVIPKHPGTRQRRNRASTRSVLPSAEESAQNEVPVLPFRPKDTGKWHPKVIEWWESIWRSPMAAEFLDADMRGGLYLLAELYQLRWTTVDPQELLRVSAEIRQQEVRFGGSPIDRRRLQWEIEKGESATEKTQSRRQKQAPSNNAKDPRNVLRMA
jgi:hypothetical protein